MSKSISKRLLSIVVFLTITILSSFSQNDYYYVAGSTKPTFSNALNGIKSYNFDCISNGGQIDQNNCAFIDAYIIEQMKLWASNTMPDAVFGVDYRCPSLSYVKIVASYDWFDQIRRNGTYRVYANNIKIYFILGGDPNSPYASPYQFNLPSFNIAAGNFNDNQFYNMMLSSIDNKKHYYAAQYTMRLPKYKTSWSETSLKSYYATTEDKIEGIYECTSPLKNGEINKYTLAVKKMPSGNYDLIYIKGANQFDDWSQGEIKALLNPTGSPYTYKAEWLMLDKSVNKNCYITFNLGGLMTVRVDSDLDTYQKIYPYAGNTPANRNTFGR